MSALSVLPTYIPHVEKEDSGSEEGTPTRSTTTTPTLVNEHLATTELSTDDDAKQQHLVLTDADADAGRKGKQHEEAEEKRYVYKGKCSTVQRGWDKLPDKIVRYIATLYIYDSSSRRPIPHSLLPIPDEPASPVPTPAQTSAHAPATANTSTPNSTPAEAKTNAASSNANASTSQTTAFPIIPLTNPLISPGPIPPIETYAHAVVNNPNLLDFYPLENERENAKQKHHNPHQRDRLREERRRVIWGENRNLYFMRNIWIFVRDTPEMERLMGVCVPWGRALETHDFWLQALRSIDLLDVTMSYNYMPLSSSNPITPYQHYKNILSLSCFPCRLNHSQSPQGLCITRKRIWFFGIQGWIGVCREHMLEEYPYPSTNNKGIWRWCGVCGKEEPRTFSHDRERERERIEMVGIQFNEDEDSFPGVDWTCRDCRAEVLIRRLSDNDPISKPSLTPRIEDHELNASLSGFLLLGEGTVDEVLICARERGWLWDHTRLKRFLEEAVASARFEKHRTKGKERSSPGLWSYERELDSEFEEEEEEEYDLQDSQRVPPRLRKATSPTLSDYSQTPSLDSTFALETETNRSVKELALNDWIRGRILGGEWTCPLDGYYGLGSSCSSGQRIHPCPWALQDKDEEEEKERILPPTYNLTLAATHAYRRVLSGVLLPAMKNVLKLLIAEHSSEEEEWEDVLHRVGKLDIGDVVHRLKTDQSVWFDNPDCAISEDAKLPEHIKTLFTPPSEPRLLSSIPYIPSDILSFPPYSLDTLKSIWRETLKIIWPLTVSFCTCQICARNPPPQSQPGGPGEIRLDPREEEEFEEDWVSSGSSVEIPYPLDYTLSKKRELSLEVGEREEKRVRLHENGEERYEEELNRKRGSEELEEGERKRRRAEVDA